MSSATVEIASVAEVTTEQARAIGCAIIGQAYEDMHNAHVYTNPSREAQKVLDQQSALEFFRGQWFVAICEACNLDAEKIKRKALT